MLSNVVNNNEIEATKELPHDPSSESSPSNSRPRRRRRRRRRRRLYSLFCDTSSLSKPALLRLTLIMSTATVTMMCLPRSSSSHICAKAFISSAHSILSVRSHSSAMHNHMHNNVHTTLTIPLRDRKRWSEPHIPPSVLFSSSSSSSSPSSNLLRQEKQSIIDNHSTLQLAPMMDYTDRHFRYLVRLISRRTLLWTEMIAGNTLAYERKQQIQELNKVSTEEEQNSSTSDDSLDYYSDEYLRRYLGQARRRPSSLNVVDDSSMTAEFDLDNSNFMREEGPCILQLGGSSPELMAEAAETVMDMTDRGWCDYTGLNLNVGCPSPKVAGKGCFGAALMDDPALVRDVCRALHEGSSGQLPVSVKCRIGTDTPLDGFSKESYAAMDPEIEYNRLRRFIETVASDGVVTDFAVHARIAVLKKSFSPADNRKVPPLKYDIVRRLVADYPNLKFTLNGGIDTISQAQHELEKCPGLAGVMVGRSWAADPWSFAMADHLLYDRPESGGSDNALSAPNVSELTRWDILQEYARYADEEEQHNDPVKMRRFITKAVTTLFTGEPRAKRYRIALEEVGGIPKRLSAQGKSMDGQPPLSELILDAATTHLSEDVLRRTPQESYKRLLYQESRRVKKDQAFVMSSAADSQPRSKAISEWQSDRQREQQSVTNEKRAAA